eukprot:TRINITY_DN3946_c0_g1_i2.p1 TRINITY_DN3946_c0_g1~~TRINITY_DN3946_c0_g1_i2.p1  ORF type:complete len:176 (+),score=51.67 TRINITY_DN3946_c0_g1_i2:314-841(+)
MLAEIPQLRSLYSEAYNTLDNLDRFLGSVESSLSTVLIKDGIPDTDLVQAIAVSKVQAVETAISLCFRLKQEVGSYALMGGTGFEHLDFLQCCKFAEGDSRILMQKMARDTMRAFSKNKGSHLSPPETEQCGKLAAALKNGGKDAWNDNWEMVYELAALVQLRIVKAWTATSAKL